MNKKRNRSWLNVTFCAIALFAVSFSVTGCQMSIGGQTLPSGYYLDDDIQYFPKGPENKLWRESDALREARTAELLDN